MTDGQDETWSPAEMSAVRRWPWSVLVGSFDPKIPLITVFNEYLKLLTDKFCDCKWSGSEFQADGTAYENRRRP